MTRPRLRRLRRRSVRREAAAASDIPPRSRPGRRLEIVRDAEAVPRASSTGAADHGTELVEQQLIRLEERLLAEVQGDPAAERQMRQYFGLACAHFAAATVRQYLPILVERDVRGRFSGRNGTSR